MPKASLFPHDARFNQVMGLLRLLYHNNRSLTVAELTTMSHMRVDTLLPQLNAAQFLGLVTLKEGRATLTKLGDQIHVNDQKAKEQVSKKLVTMEPFKAAYSLSKKKHMFSTGDLVVELEKNGLSHHTDYVKNRSLLHTTLIQWAIYFDILDYNGRDKRWLENA